MRRFFLSVLMVLSFHPVAQASVISQHVPDAAKVGEGRLSVLFWDVYDATLYAPEGRWDGSKPFALSLNYLHAIKGQDIANASVEEIRKQGFTDEIKLAAWHTQMREIFPDVTLGTELTGIYMPGEPTRFYQDGQQIGMIHDAKFGHYFFNIWLAENTSNTQLRHQLLGAR